MENTTRTESVLVRLTKKEKERLETEAIEAGVPLSTFVYEKATADTLSIETKRLESLIYQLQEDTANRIDNLELKIQENQKELTDDFGEFTRDLAKFLTSKFNQLQATPATQPAQQKVDNKDEYVQVSAEDFEYKGTASLYELKDRFHLATGEVFEVTEKIKGGNSLKAKNIKTEKEFTVDITKNHEKIVKIERLKSLM